MSLIQIEEDSICIDGDYVRAWKLYLYENVYAYVFEEEIAKKLAAALDEVVCVCPPHAHDEFCRVCIPGES